MYLSCIQLLNVPYHIFNLLIKVEDKVYFNKLLLKRVAKEKERHVV